MGATMSNTKPEYLLKAKPGDIGLAGITKAGTLLCYAYVDGGLSPIGEIEFSSTTKWSALCYIDDYSCDFIDSKEAAYRTVVDHHQEVVLHARRKLRELRALIRDWS